MKLHSKKSTLVLLVILVTCGLTGCGKKVLEEGRQEVRQLENQPESQEAVEPEAAQEQPKGNQRVDYDSLTEEEKSNLVWYEIPEMGIKFKVTPEMKEELVYVYEGEEDILWGDKKGMTKKASLSGRTIMDELNGECSVEYGHVGQGSKNKRQAR